MGRERQTLTVEHISKGIRYRRMVKGKVWTSQVYDSDTRQNKQEAWESFKLWREHRTCQAQKSTASVRTLSTRPSPELNPNILNALHVGLPDQKSSGLEAIIPNLSLLALEQIGRILHHHFSGTDTVLHNQQRHIIDSLGSSTKSQPTIGELADQLINLYMVKAKSGDISIGRYGDVKYGLNYFLDWFGRSTPVTEITEATVSGYYQFQLSRITEGANRNSCSKHMAIFNLFVDFCAQEVAAFKKPNNLRSRQYRLSQAGSDVAVFTNHEVSLLLRSCNSRMKLYMLLMLNCAMYQGDVASITADDVDWENGRIIVARSKKEKLSDGPTVKCNWILWDETWKLLQDLGNRDGLVLTNVNGKPLLVNGIDKNGKPTKTDNIRTIFARLVTKLKNQGALPERWHKSLKHWRKTGCNIIEKSIDHAEFYALYLNHGTVAKRHYLVSGQPVPKFDAAVKWLGEQFGFKTTR